MIAIKNFRIPVYTWEVAEELSMFVRHLKQIGKVKKLDKWADLMSWQKILKKIAVWVVTLFCATAMNIFLIGLWSATKSRFYTTASGDQLSGWTEKLQSTSQSQTSTKKKGHGPCLVVCCPSDLWQFSESWWNLYVQEVWSANLWDAPKTASACSWHLSTEWAQYLTACHTTNASKVERIGLQDFASSAVFTWPLTNQLPFFQVSWQLFAGKMLPQPARDRKCFPRVCQIPKHRFLMLQE